MILDTLNHAGNYTALHPLFPAAFDYLRQFDPNTLDGKYEIDGDRLYAVVQRYETAPDEARIWEAHRVYADIQFMVSGRERMIHAPVEELRTGAPYNEAKDVRKYDDEHVRNATSVIVGGGSFCVFLPQDGHKPGCMVDRPEAVVKVVIKVKLKA